MLNCNEKSLFVVTKYLIIISISVSEKNMIRYKWLYMKIQLTIVYHKMQTSKGFHKKYIILNYFSKKYQKNSRIIHKPYIAFHNFL